MNGTDFPFSGWETYFPALEMALNTEFYHQHYPHYHSIHEELGLEVNIRIVDEFLNQGNSAQRGLDLFIQSVLCGSRYDNRWNNTLRIMMFHLMDHGAIPIVHPIITIRYEPHWEQFEDEMTNVKRRGLLLSILDSYYPQGIDLEPEWLQSIPVYWENIPTDRSIDYMEAFRRAVLHEMSIYEWN